MKARPILVILFAVIASLLLIGASHVHAADNAIKGTAGSAGTAAPAQGDSAAPIYGSQMMTPEERDAYRQRMRDANTFEEREKIRAGHHETMRMRAMERGVTLPDVPPGRGPGMGPGKGPGAGPGMGMGPGGGPGPGAGGGGPARTAP